MPRCGTTSAERAWLEIGWSLCIRTDSMHSSRLLLSKSIDPTIEGHLPRSVVVSAQCFPQSERHTQIAETIFV
jgi:hypothetical protein